MGSVLEPRILGRSYATVLLVSHKISSSPMVHEIDLNLLR